MPTTAMPMPGYGAGPLTAERLRELLSYDPDTGFFVWRVQKGRRGNVGERAGSIGGFGYRQVRIDGTTYREHRLAWFYMTGAWPTGEMDHRDTDRTNNAWHNLRLATRSQNMANRRAKNRHGFKGINYIRKTGRWLAQICVNYKKMHVGVYSTREEAHAAYVEAAIKHHGEFARAT